MSEARPEPTLLGRILIQAKLIGMEQLNEALDIQGRIGLHKQIGDILVEIGYINRAQLAWALKAQAQMQGGAGEAAGPAPSVATPGATTPTPAAAGAPGGAAAPAVTQAPQVVPAMPTPVPVAAVPGAAGAPTLGGGAVKQVDVVLAQAVKMGASDVHIHAGAPIQLRYNGQLVASGESLEAADTEAMVMGLLPPGDRERLAKYNDLDFAYTLAGVGRFRANAYRQKRGYDVVFRAIPADPPTFETLGLPNILARLTTYHQGLVLLTGPAGSGKTATLAALVNLINEERSDHIITVEDPIEYIHKSKRCLVNQRQVVRHTESFAAALRAALREDPDIIAIGELRDLETVSLAITASETGHLVLATLHTNSTVRTINRVLDVFPPAQQNQIRAMVSESLRAVVSQRLVPTADGKRRVPALEVLFINHAIANLIREDKTFQIRSVLQTGRSQGMCLLDHSLLDLVKAGTVAKETARRFADDARSFA